jgi:hypothetical protein
MRRLLLLTTAAALVAAAPAAAFEVAVPTAAPADVKAGQHSDVKLRIEPKDGQVKDIDIHFPPGLVGDPHATPLCTIQQFESDSCPPETQVGTSNTEATVLGIPQTLAGTIFNLTPRGPEPARLGIKIDSPNGTVRLESPVTSRPSDGGLDSTLRDIPNSSGPLSIQITAIETVLFGKASTGKAFMQNPTSCGDEVTVIDATAYDGSKAQGSAKYSSTDCEKLPFDPSFEGIVGAPGQTAAKSNPPFTTVVGQVPGEANVKRVSVTLPSALGVGADRLVRACPTDAFNAGTCDKLSTIGQATAITPLLSSPLEGPVMFVQGQSVPDIVLSLRGPLSLTLRGVNVFTPAGQVTTFDGIPDVPLSRFELRFNGGFEGLLVASRDLCGGTPIDVAAKFVSHAGTVKEKTIASKVEGCTGVDTPPVPRLARPKATVRVAGLRKGRPSLRLRVTAATGARLRRVRLNLPKGMTLSKRTRLKGAKVRSKRRVIEIPGRAGGTRAISLTLRSGTLTVTRKLRKAKRLRFGVVATEVGGRRTTRRISVKPRK